MFEWTPKILWDCLWVSSLPFFNALDSRTEKCRTHSNQKSDNGSPPKCTYISTILCWEKGDQLAKKVSRFFIQQNRMLVNHKVFSQRMAEMLVRSLKPLFKTSTSHSSAWMKDLFLDTILYRFEDWSSFCGRAKSQYCPGQESSWALFSRVESCLVWSSLVKSEVWWSLVWSCWF